MTVYLVFSYQDFIDVFSDEDAAEKFAAPHDWRVVPWKVREA